ncbi:MAG: hypothetical protein U0795_16305 [Pirellulales bacterium]|jgi:hypothetical protein
MSYSELIQAYFERSVALQWYWTIYVLVIGGVLAFSTLRRQREVVTTLLVTLLYIGFAYRNLGAIVSTATERASLLAAAKAYVPDEADKSRVEFVRGKLDSALPEYDIAGARNFHLMCDALTVAYLWAKEWRRRQPRIAR